MSEFESNLKEFFNQLPGWLQSTGLFDELNALNFSLALKNMFILVAGLEVNNKAGNDLGFELTERVISVIEGCKNLLDGKKFSCTNGDKTVPGSIQCEFNDFKLAYNEFFEILKTFRDNYESEYCSIKWDLVNERGFVTEAKKLREVLQSLANIVGELFKDVKVLDFANAQKEGKIPVKQNPILEEKFDTYKQNITRERQISTDTKKDIDNFLSEVRKILPGLEIDLGHSIYDAELNAIKDKINELIKNQNKSSNYKQKDDEIAGLKKEKEKLESEKNDLTQQLDNLKKEIKALEEKNHDKQIKDLFEQIENYKKQIEAKNFEPQKNSAETKELENKISALENDNPDENNKRIKKLEEENKKLLEAKKAADDELAKLKKSKDETRKTPTDISVFDKITPSKAGNTALLIFSGAGTVVGLVSGSFVLAFLISCPSSVLIVGMVASGFCSIAGIVGLGVGASNVSRSNIAKQKYFDDIDKKGKKPKQTDSRGGKNNNEEL